MAKEIEIKVKYDKDDDVMYLLDKDYSGDTITKHHPDEELIDLLLAVDTGEVVGLLITHWRIFETKRLTHKFADKIANLFWSLLPAFDHRLRECYSEFANTV